MDRETKSVSWITLVCSLGGWACVFWFVSIAVRAHSLGRSTSGEVVYAAGVCAVLLAMMSAYGAWIAYLIFSRFLTNLEASEDGYALEVRGRPFGHAKRLTIARRLGVTELALVRVDGEFWVCHSSKLAALRSARGEASAI
jgi:hypothetical protein